MRACCSGSKFKMATLEASEGADVQRLPCMDIQCNWNEEAKKDKGKFWVSCKKQGEKTIHGYLQKQTNTTDDKFSITTETARSITIECAEAGCSTKFIRPLKTLRLHERKLLCMNVSESGGLGVCSSDDGRLWVWDADSGETRRELAGHVMDVDTCRFFPSGIVVLSGGTDMRLKIWSAQDGSCPRTLTGHTGGITDTAIIDRGRNIVSVSRDGSARLWDCGSARCLATLATLSCPINSCALASSGIARDRNTTPPPEPECGTSDKLLLLACDNGMLQAIDVRNRESVFQYHPGTVAMAACAFVSEFSAVCGNEDGVVSTVDLRVPGEAVQRLSFSSSPLTCLQTLSGHRCLSGQADGSCTMWHVDDITAPVSKLTGPDVDRITNVQVSGNKIYSSCRDGCVRIYSLDDVHS